MPSLHAWFGVIASILIFFEFYVYILAIYGRDYRLQKLAVRTTPNRATWFIWALLGVIAAISYWQSGATDTLWFSVAYALGFILVALLSIKYGEGGFTALDIFCLLGAIVSIGLWWQFDSPAIALYTILAIDFFGAVPTVVKAWRSPAGENRLAWSMTVIACVLNALAINWGSATFAIAIYPLYMLVANAVITALLFRPLLSPEPRAPERRATRLPRKPMAVAL